MSPINENTPFIKELNDIGQRIRTLPPEKHSALVVGIIGGLKGAASYDPEGIRAAVHSIEAVLEEFEEPLQQQG